MGNHDRSRPPSLRWAAAGLLLAALASTASALTLSNFQVITSSTIPIPCILVYNTVIPSCTTDDFTMGNSCSAACAAGLARVQDKIQDVCDGVSISAATVLGQTLMGNLVSLLCPTADNAPPSKQTTSTITTSSRTSTSTSTSSSSSTAAGTTSFAQSTLTSVTAPPPASPRPPPPPDSPGAAPTFASSSSVPSDTAQPTDAPLGGGSPFDVVPTSEGSQTRGLLGIWLALGAGMWLLC
ncbi:hypothetical protein QBC47DRAFT_72149 [Echria macrotheca]|uniref:Extracellular membrane protein CFEM domain-containing protein n=1 Tax=Echria macrotheca TaxID=438768 RepID=A0AAJ0B4R2_9PEZI|nr:hypothetical protein QBC47DRAFT_72149 [Echria macrotheca]